MIVGQDSLIEKINNYNLDTLPNPLLLLGEEGCGKKTLINYIINKFNLDYIDMTDKIEPEDLTSYLLCPTPIFYIINLNDIAYKQQNKLLKFIEEPTLSKNIYLLIYADSELNIINTILNRCHRLYFEPYKKESLSLFNKGDIKEDIVYSIYNTPGKIKEFDLNKWNELNKLSSVFVEKLKEASFPNTLTIINKMDFKGTKEKLNADYFLYLNSINIKNNYCNSKNDVLYSWFILNDKYIKLIKNKNYNKEHIMYNYLIDSWLLFHS